MKTLSIILVIFVFSQINLMAQNGFALIKESKPACISVSVNTDAGIMRAITAFRGDVQKVCGVQPDVLTSGKTEQSVIVGTVESQIIKESGIDLSSLKGANEKYIMVVDGNRLVIAGSDKRGTIYGIYALSERMGVSPWTWWADVPVLKQNNVTIPDGIYTEGEPKVEYRGIFLNDEAPALSGWVYEKFKGFNHNFYEHVFELILRLRGNFLWPAMWGRAFFDDDAENGRLANEMGIVVGTSHHEPMGRAHDEWRRQGGGAWNYQTNTKRLDEFWRSGLDRMKDYETFVTIGMRGDGDEAMSEGTNIALLEKIVKNQRKIISSVTGKKASDVPQVWALYKEVQNYYDRGMKVPDDVTLMLCDDNWGNVRRLPSMDAKPRTGGYGMYYHFDYVGDPRNYKWLNVTQIQRTWEQLDLTYRHGVKKIWIANVGDLKPMEYPIQFFMDMAWNPDAFNADNILKHTEDFCVRQFGEKYAKEAARLIDQYTKYNHRRTPELLNAQTYSFNYNEWQRVVEEYRTLELDAQRLGYLMPAVYRDAYEQLILFPISACANLYEMYYAVAMNHALAEKNDPEANRWAQKVKQLYERDSLLTYHYNHEIAGGKWNHMMDQTHIGYTYWQQPEYNSMPELRMVREPKIAAAPCLFEEREGCISMEAEHYTRKSGSWMTIPNLGRTLSAIRAKSVENAFVEYEMDTHTSGTAKVYIALSPTLSYEGKCLHYAVSIDGGEEQIVDIHKVKDPAQTAPWEEWVAIGVNITETTFTIEKTGKHILRFRPLDEGLVLQKIMVDMGGLKPSYLGAPETLKK